MVTKQNEFNHLKLNCSAMEKDYLTVSVTKNYETTTIATLIEDSDLDESDTYIKLKPNQRVELIKWLQEAEANYILTGE